MQFHDALEGYWLSRRREFSKATILDYGLTFKRFAQYLGTRSIQEITARDINKFLNETQDRYHLGNKSLANVWTALSSFWTWAEVELEIKHPMRGIIKLPTFRSPPIEPYTEAEVLAMLEATKRSSSWKARNGSIVSSRRPTARRDYTIIVVLLDTGIRSSELCDLQLRDYEKQTGRLDIRHGKGNKRRVVYLGETARKHMWRYMLEREGIKANDPLFVTRSGKPLERDELLNMITATARRAGVNRANVHKFRHTFAVNFLRNGGNVLHLQQLLGHESIETLKIYVRLAEIDLAKAQQIASPADNWNL